MQPTSDIGMEIRRLRKQSGESLQQVAEAIQADRSYLNKIELGSVMPSSRLLEKLLVHFSVEGNEAVRLRQIAGHVPFEVVFIDSRKEEHNHMPEEDTPTAQMPQISINPSETKVLYTDSTFVSSTDYGLVLDVAQITGGQQHNVVARIGMSFDHAKKLLEVIQDHIEKNER